MNYDNFLISQQLPLYRSFSRFEDSRIYELLNKVLYVEATNMLACHKESTFEALKMVRDDERGNWKMNRILIAKQQSFIIDNYLWNILCVWELELAQKISENVTELLMNRTDLKILNEQSNHKSHKTAKQFTTNL